MKKVHLSEETVYLELFNRMLKENKLLSELQMKLWPQRRQSWEEVYKLSFKENLIKRLIKYTLSKKNWSNSNKKFFVLGLRYKEILTSLPNAETLLITSSIREVLFSIFKGYDWIYLGQADVLLLRSFFETDTNELFSLFKKVIRLLNNSNRKKFILSTSDTKALPTLFRWASKLNKEINHTVCLQHGVFFKGGITEGNLADFSLLFSSSQVNYAKKIFDKPDNLIELGPPWNIPVVEDRSSCEVILVSGGGWGQENELHLKTLDILIDVSRLLDKLKIDYSFRPHPFDILEGENKNFKRINSQPSEKILSGNPKIFIGFVSTLLLDAYCCGHTIIQINHEMQKDKLILESDFVILEKELNLISQIIEDNVVLKRRNRDFSSNTLDLRLRDAFNHIERKLLENNNERKKSDLREN
jgi:hypothetical protein